MSTEPIFKDYADGYVIDEPLEIFHIASRIGYKFIGHMSIDNINCWAFEICKEYKENAGCLKFFKFIESCEVDAENYFELYLKTVYNGE